MGEAENTLQDNQGRVVDYMRVSLTPACDYRCCFCVPDDEDGAAAEPAPGRLSRDEVLRLCGIFASLGVNSFKITGGEPFMSPDALPVMAALKATAGVRNVTVTTNGRTLDRHAASLAAIPVDGVNVSVNAMDPECYRRIAGADFPVRNILDNIDLARALGLRVKLNMVPLRGMNERDIVPLLEFALARDIPVRFIELMPLGQGRRYSGLSFAEVRAVIEARFGPAAATAERLGSGPARYLSLAGHAARVGYIAAVGQRFCDACNRIRLSSDGFLRTCLHHDHGADLAAPLRSGESNAALAARIRRAVAEKPQGHCFDSHPGAMGREPMYRIGG